MLVVETAPINIYHKLRSQLSAFQVSLWVKMSNSILIELPCVCLAPFCKVGILLQFTPGLLKRNKDCF